MRAQRTVPLDGLVCVQVSHTMPRSPSVLATSVSEVWLVQVLQAQMKCVRPTLSWPSHACKSLPKPQYSPKRNSGHQRSRFVCCGSSRRNI